MDALEVARLIDSLGPPLALYARQWCDSPDDVVQEAFIKLVSQQRRPADSAAWLYRVVRNAAIAQARSSRRRTRREAVKAAQTPNWFAPPIDDLGPDPADAAAALAGLPLGEREVVVAHLWGGLTFGQIGELCACSSSTAHRRYLSALEALRQRLGVPCPATDPKRT